MTLTVDLLAALREELTTDPAGLGYAGMQPEQVRTALASATVETIRNVPLDELQAYLMTVVADGQTVPAWWVLKSAAATNPVAEMAYDLFSSRLQALDVRLPTVQMLLGQLVATSVLTQDIADAIVAMSHVTVARGVALFGAIPTVLEIQFALLDD